MASERPPGYVSAVLARGKVADDEWLEISSEALSELRVFYRPALQPEPALPSLSSMARAVAKAAAAEVTARLWKVPSLTPEEIDARLATCTAPCDHYRTTDTRCALCGCVTAFKALLRSQDCPAGKWPPAKV